MNPFEINPVTNVLKKMEFTNYVSKQNSEKSINQLTSLKEQIKL